MPEQHDHDRLVEGSRLIYSGLRVQLPQLRQATLTALYRDTALSDEQLPSCAKRL